MSESLANKASAGAVWATVDRFGFMALQFAINIVMARLLVPQDFGVIGMLAIFISVSQSLVDGGFGSALIQKKEPTQTDYSTIFFWNLGFSIFLYVILFLSAPAVGRFFDIPVLCKVLRVVGLNVIISSLLLIQTTRLRKQFSFRTIAISNLVSYAIGGALAIILAHKGFGVWSLVIMQLTYVTVNFCMLEMITRWLPSLCFSRESMRQLFSFGGYILAAGILQTICQNIQGVIIGRKFSASQMGYYSQAYKLDQVTSYSIPQVIVQVMYPVYSSIQDDTRRLIEMLEMNIRVISFIVFPILGLLIVIAPQLIIALYGEQWVPCVPYFRILCVGGAFVCLQNINFYAVAAVGRSKTLFYWSIYKWSFLLSALFVGALFGMDGLLWGMVLSSVNIWIVNAMLAAHHVHFPLYRQLRSIMSSILITLGCTLTTLALVLYSELHVTIIILFYATIYFAISFPTKSFSDFKSLITRLFHKSK